MRREEERGWEGGSSFFCPRKKKREVGAYVACSALLCVITDAAVM